MTLPIVAYGAAVLRKLSEPINADYPNLSKLIEDMWETMYDSNGVGLAAPQINRAIRLFVMDSQQIFENAEPEDETFPDAPGIKRAFINAEIVELSGKEWVYNEGCLSIPKIREDVVRHEKVTLKYMDENFVEKVETFDGMTARIILHEYDHIEGKLFIDYIKPLKKKMLQGKLNDIHKGKVRVDYKMTNIK
ncbi:MAG: peptide deformylase [Sediminibacterium sp.]|jgi:peptide deformylase|nr:peptide deformylase [Sediminibacterium sp.]MBP6144858.1 peptide deformylase [Sediminibacterium sp.]MBP7940103.1 peptide deformylase [Sediminibacterium sp.]